MLQHAVASANHFDFHLSWNEIYLLTSFACSFCLACAVCCLNVVFSSLFRIFVFGALFSPRSTPLLPVIVCQSIIYNFRFIRFDSHNFVPFPSSAKMKLCKLALLFKRMRQSHEDDTHTHTHNSITTWKQIRRKEGKKNYQSYYRQHQIVFSIYFLFPSFIFGAFIVM